ncbi:unnamed protein product, partial [Ectocarpus sp. 8 AP-2014]
RQPRLRARRGGSGSVARSSNLWVCCRLRRVLRLRLRRHVACCRGHHRVGGTRRRESGRIRRRPRRPRCSSSSSRCVRGCRLLRESGSREGARSTDETNTAAVTAVA